MNYFVTGATGFIGRHLVERLLDRGGEIHVLVREGSLGRLENLIDRWGPEAAGRVHPLIGDLTKPRLGVSDEEIAALTGNVDHFFHLAAVYDMTADEESNRIANVEGTRHAVELANTIDAGIFHHTSSIAAAGQYKGMFREDMFDEGQPLPTPYHQTKFESERIARSRTTVPWRVYRPAVVVGHSWGASVALATAAAAPGRVLSTVAIDGGITTPAGIGPRDEVRRRLEPPRLAVPPADFATMIGSGPLAGAWTPAHAEAVLPAFALGEDGLARARLTFDLHMKVLDGLLDADVEAVLGAVTCPCWTVSCEPVEGGLADASYHDEAWARARAQGLERAARLLARPRLLRWGGAVHDVPLQWPSLVAGLVLAAYDEVSPRPSGGSA